MKKWLLIIGVLFAPLAQAELKIGTVRLPVLMKAAFQAHPEKATIQSKRQEGERLLAAKEQALKALDAQLKNDAAGLSTEQRAQISLRMNALRREAKSIQDGYNDELKLLQRRIENDAILQIQAALTKFAKDNSYDVILPLGPQGALYASPKADVTQLIRTLMQ